MCAPTLTVYYKLKLRYPTLDMPIIDYGLAYLSSVNCTFHRYCYAYTMQLCRSQTHIFTNQVIAQLELWNEKGTFNYKNNMYVLPRNNLDGKVTAFHLGRLRAKLSKDNALHASSVDKQYGGSCRVPNEHVVTGAAK